MAFAVIMTVCFLRIDNDQIGVQNKLGFLYEVLSLLFVGQLNSIAMCTLSFPPALGMQAAANIFRPSLVPGERNVFYRERTDGLYGTVTFLLSYMSIEVPFDVRWR